MNGNDYPFNHWVSTSMVSSTIDNIRSIATQNFALNYDGVNDNSKW